MQLPSNPYGGRPRESAAGGRPISQGDVFDDLPLVGAAQPHTKQEGTWVSTKPRRSLGLLITHPCGSRSRETHKLLPVLSVAPVVRCPSNWGPPWDGYYNLMPLPDLSDGQHYVAKLNEVCPVAAVAFGGIRVAYMAQEGLEALYHRLAMNSLRFPETPAHYAAEAGRLSGEIDLWEVWVRHAGSEDGYQAWLDAPFGGQPIEGPDGEFIEGSVQPTGQSRREVLLWNREEIETELLRDLK